MKKIFILFLLTILSITLSSCAAKVHLIEDSFYGQKFYQTDYISMSFWSSTVKLRLKNISGTNSIVLEAQYVSDDAFNIAENSKIVLKFSDNTFVNLYYTSLMPKTDVEVIYGTSIYFMDTSYVDRTYSIQAENEIKKLSILTDIRVETAEGFKNFKVKEKYANELIRLYNEINESINNNI